MELIYILNIFLLFTIRTVLVSALDEMYYHGLCSRSQRFESGGKIYYSRKVFCCEDSKNGNDICIECSPDALTREGGTCHPCPKWTYAYICIIGCQCKENQKCHNEYGCIEDVQPRKEVHSTEDVTTKMTVTTEHSVQTSGMVKTEVFIVSLFGVGTFIILCFSIGCVYKRSHKANINPNSNTDQNIGVNNRIYEVDNTVERSQLVSRERATDNEYIAML